MSEISDAGVIGVGEKSMDLASEPVASPGLYLRGNVVRLKPEITSNPGWPGGEKPPVPSWLSLIFCLLLDFVWPLPPTRQPSFKTV